MLSNRQAVAHSVTNHHFCASYQLTEKLTGEIVRWNIERFAVDIIYSYFDPRISYN
jgi:hypothetical protein